MINRNLTEMAQCSAVDAELTNWLSEQLASDDLQIEPLVAEASHRSFFRVRQGERCWVLMQAPAPLEDAGRFVQLAEWFRHHWVPVPQILGADLDKGLVLMTDLGQRHLLDAYESGNVDDALEVALTGLIEMQRLPLEVPAYTADRLADELEIFSEWLLGRLLQEAPLPNWGDLVSHLVDVVQDQPVTVVHRDYHCKNLLLGPDGSLGIVDFQDALAGPALYDLASLLHDCYYHLEPATIQSWLEWYLEHTDLVIEQPAKHFELTALQRQLKAIGIFSRLYFRDGKRSHLAYIPTVMRQSAHLASKHSLTSDLSNWLDQNVTRTAQAIDTL